MADHTYNHTYTWLDTNASAAALAGLEAGLEVGLETDGQGGLTLTEHWPFVAQQFTWLGDMPKSMPQTAAAGAKLNKTETIVPYMPGKILRIAAKAKQIDGALAVDLTDGRALLSLAGKNWRWPLMKGCGLDFEAMKVGDCATTTLFKIGVTLWVTAEDEVRILVSYNYARALAIKLQDAAYEGGMQIVTA